MISLVAIRCWLTLLLVFCLQFGPNLDDAISFQSGGSNELLPDGTLGRLTGWFDVLLTQCGD
jgi:hypothetical protein